ncbi:MAG: hypothetical protein WC437_02055 [Patescibacteria group bacterium]
MAIFLVIYTIFLIIWLIWSSISTYHLVKYGLPNSNTNFYLYGYCFISALVLTISVLYIAKADWTTVPRLFKP